MRSLITFSAVLFCAIQVNAQTRYWIGNGTSTSWASTGNWSLTSGGASGAAVPAATDTVIFDGNGVGSCTMDQNVNIKRIVVNSGYTGTISHTTYTVTIGTSGAVFSGGTFQGGDTAITVEGPFEVSGAAFQSTTDLLFLKGSFTFSSGSFIHNSGTVKFLKTCKIAGSASLNHLEFSTSGSTASGYTIATGTTLTVNGNLTFTGTAMIVLDTAIIEAKGNILLNNTGSGGNLGTATILINGTGDQTITGTSALTYNTLPNITIDKSLGKLTLSGYVNVLRNWSYLQGQVDDTTNNATVNFISHSDFTNSTISGSPVFNNLSVYQGANKTKTLQMPTGDTVTVLNLLKYASSTGSIVLNGTYKIKGNIEHLNNGSNVSTGTLIICGSGNQSLTGTSTAKKIPGIIVDKPGGTFTLTTTEVFGNFTRLRGEVDAITNSPTVTINGSAANRIVSGFLSFYNLSFYHGGGGDKYFTVPSGDTINVAGEFKTSGKRMTIMDGVINAKGDLTLLHGNTNIVGTATLNICGTGDQSFTGSGIAGSGKPPVVKINKPSGTLYLKSIITLYNSWNYIQGTIDAVTHNSTIFCYMNMTFTGSHTINNLTLSFFGNSRHYTVEANTILGAAGTVSIEGTGYPYIDGGRIDAKGNISITNSAGTNNGTATINICGTGDQVLTGNSTENTGRLPNVKINKPTGILKLENIISIGKLFEYEQGAVDAATDSSTVVFMSAAETVDGQGTSGVTLPFYNVKFLNGSRTLAGNLEAKNNLTIAGSTTLYPGSNQVTLEGNWINDGTCSPTAGAVKFTGTKKQTVTKSSGEQEFFDLVLDKAADSLLFNSPVRIKDTLTLVQGFIKATSTNLLTFSDNASSTGASDLSYVDGPVKKIGDDAFSFPLGKAGYYHPLGITAPANTTDAYKAEYFNTAHAFVNTFEPTLEYISSCEYWSLEQVTGTSSVKLTLNWNTNSCGIDLSKAGVAAWNGQLWTDQGNSLISGTATVGSVTSANNISSSIGINPIPLVCKTAAGFEDPNVFKINTVYSSPMEYTMSGAGLSGTYQTGNTQRFWPQKPSDRQFSTIAMLIPGNDTILPLTIHFDINDTVEISNLKMEFEQEVSELSLDFYRLSADKRTIEFITNGNQQDTTTNALEIKLNLKDGLVLTPNATSYSVLNITGLENIENTQLAIYNANDELVFQTADTNAQQWDGKVVGSVVPGLYRYDLTIEGEVLNGQFFVSDEQ